MTRALSEAGVPVSDMEWISGAMGVPITFFDKYNPDQFEITGITKTWYGTASKTYGFQTQVNKNGSKSIVSKLNDGPAIKLHETPKGMTYYVVDDNCYIQTYARVLIRPKRGGNN